MFGPADQVIESHLFGEEHIEIFRQYDGEFLAVDDDPLVLEGEKDYTLTVLVRFPDRAGALAWFRSDAYQELAAIRWSASSAEISLIEGLAEQDVE